MLTSKFCMSNFVTGRHSAAVCAEAEGLFLWGRGNSMTLVAELNW